jgi:hypothetical protein
MASRSSTTPAAPGQPAPAQPAPARQAAVRKKAVVAAPAQDPAERLLRAGLKALGKVRNELVQQHTHAIERLLGIQRSDARADPPLAPLGLGAMDSFGLRKFEDVFDQRVATALQRLGMPSAQELQALRDEVQQLRAQYGCAESTSKPTPKAKAESTSKTKAAPKAKAEPEPQPNPKPERRPAPAPARMSPPTPTPAPAAPAPARRQR